MAKEDLIPFNQLTEEQHKKIASMGGKASVEAKRKKKKLKEELELLMDEDGNKRKVSIALLKKGLSGDVRAIQEIAILLGERIEEQKIDSEVKVTMDKSVEELSK